MSGAAQFMRDVRRFAPVFLEGTVLYVDPASGGSGGSKPGWAYSEGGELVDSGVVDLVKGKITDRLVDLVTQLSYPLFKYGAPDLLVMEELRGSRVHPYLAWSVGVTVATINAETVLEIPITCWKAFAEADTGYAKGDEADARAFAHTCLALARGESAPARKRVGSRVGRTTSAADAARRARAKRTAAARARRVRATKSTTKGKRSTRTKRRGKT